MKCLLMTLATLWMVSITGCAATAAAEEEQAADTVKTIVKSFGAPVNNGSAIAARILPTVKPHK